MSDAIVAALEILEKCFRFSFAGWDGVDRSLVCRSSCKQQLFDHCEESPLKAESNMSAEPASVRCRVQGCDSTCQEEAQSSGV